MKNTKVIIARLDAFTLIELLVVISIIAVLLAISVFSIQSARSSSRDARRKADLESIRSALEMYRADCGAYPSTLPSPGNDLVSTSACTVSGAVYLEIPDDPIPSPYSYYYAPSGSGYNVCAYLESDSPASCPVTVSCGDSNCNYGVSNP